MGIQLGEARSSTRQPGNPRQSERSDGGGLVSGGLTALRPIVMFISGAIASGVNAILGFNHALAGLIIGGFYAVDRKSVV